MSLVHPNQSSSNRPQGGFVSRNQHGLQRSGTSIQPNRQTSGSFSKIQSSDVNTSSSSPKLYDNKKSYIVYKNEMIKARTIKLIDENGDILGTYPRDEVLRMGEEQGLDVVQIHYDAETMICTAKMFDRGKHQYEKKKSDSAKKKTTNKGMKEIKFNFAIGENDLKLKIKKAKEFFADGYGVRFVTVLKGRERANPEVVLSKFKIIETECEGFGKANPLKQEPRGYSMILMALRK